MTKATNIPTLRFHLTTLFWLTLIVATFFAGMNYAKPVENKDVLWNDPILESIHGSNYLNVELPLVEARTCIDDLLLALDAMPASAKNAAKFVEFENCMNRLNKISGIDTLNRSRIMNAMDKIAETVGMTETDLENMDLLRRF